ADDPGRVARGRRDRGDGDRRRVRGEHGPRGDLGERREQLALDLKRLGRRLDDELATGEVLERARALEPLARRGRLVGAPAPALGAAVEVLRDALERALN